MLQEGERRYPDPEEDKVKIVEHFKQFVLDIHPEGYPERHAQMWQEMIGRMFRDPTSQELAEARKWGEWYEARLPKDITPELLKAYQRGTEGYVRTEFQKLARERADVYQWDANCPEYLQAVATYKFPKELFPANYPRPPKPPLVP